MRGDTTGTENNLLENTGSRIHPYTILLRNIYTEKCTPLQDVETQAKAIVIQEKPPKFSRVVEAQAKAQS